MSDCISATASRCLQIDPAHLQGKLPMLGEIPVAQQIMASGVVMATGMPVYGTIDVENREKAQRLLELMSKEVFLQQENIGFVPTQLDGYRLPDYKGHAIYVFSMQVYAVKLRLHVALIANQLVASTKPNVLEEVIDASVAEAEPSATRGHLLVRFNRLALGKMYDDVQMYWAEKSRLACHRNTILIYNLHKLYGTPIDEVPRLAEVKYGIRPYCPDHGDYSFDPQTNRCVCSVHGNRELSRQKPRLDREILLLSVHRNPARSQTHLAIRRGRDDRDRRRDPPRGEAVVCKVPFYTLFNTLAA